MFDTGSDLEPIGSWSLDVMPDEEMHRGKLHLTTDTDEAARWAQALAAGKIPTT